MNTHNMFFCIEIKKILTTPLIQSFLQAIVKHINYKYMYYLSTPLTKEHKFELRIPGNISYLLSAR